MMIGKNVAEKLGIEIGDTATVSFTPEEAKDSDKENITYFKVTGILNPGG